MHLWYWLPESWSGRQIKWGIRSKTINWIYNVVFQESKKEGGKKRLVAVVQLLHPVWLFAIPWITAYQLPCPSLYPLVFLNSCPLSQWCYPTISSLVDPFSSCLQSFPASGSFAMSSLSTLGDQSIGVSASASALPMNIQDWFSFRIDYFDLLAIEGTLRSLFQHHSLKATILWHSAFYMIQLSYPYMTTGKTVALTRRTFVGKVMSLVFNTHLGLSKILFQGASVLILWLQSLSAVILEPKELKSVTAPVFPPSICHEGMGLDAMILVYWMLF